MRISWTTTFKHDRMASLISSRVEKLCSHSYVEEN